MSFAGQTFAGLLLMAWACTSPPDYPIEPVIEYESISKTTIFQGIPTNPSDTIVVHFSFTDGDGDLSFPSDSIDIYLTDSRNEALRSIFRFPVIPQEGTGNGISGDVYIRLVNQNNICCIYQNIICINDPALPVDTFSYAIQIRDRAGNFSNVVRTDPISIICGR